MDPLAERLVRTFLEIAAIDSVSRSEASVADAIEAHLIDLGVETWRDETAAATGSDTGNLFGRLGGLAGMRPVVLCAHMDTVEPGRGVEPVLDGDVVRSAGDTVLGADDKAAVAQILEALRTIEQKDLPHGEIMVIFTVAEEQSLVGSKAMDRPAAGDGFCFVLDAHGPVGGAVLGSPGQNNVYATFHGKAAHAGISPEEGVSAITCAAESLARVRQGRIDEETTANVGTIHGGRATNIVPDRVDIAAEVRSHDAAKLESETRAMMAAFEPAADSKCSSDVRMEPQYDGFSLSPDCEIVRLFEAACAKVGIASRLETSGGGSDANVFNKAGLPALVLSTGMEQVHSTDEYVRVDQLVAGHDLVLALISEATAY
jgi:tripeptide aminopeptidase